MLTGVVIINDLSRAAGGATSLALLSARLLRERDVPVTFVTGDAGEGRTELEALGVRVVSLGSAPLLERGRARSLLNGLYNLSAFRMMRAWIAENDRPGLVYHLHTWSRILSPAIFHALKPVAERMLIHAHDYFLTCPNGLQYNFRHANTCQRTALSPACLLTHCDKRSYGQKLWRSSRQSVRQALFDVAAGASQVITIHPNMRATFLPAEPFTHKLLSPQRNAKFYMISRLNPEKGFEDAAAAARLAKVQLSIIGDGPGRDLLRTHYPEVEVLGWRAKSEIGALLVDARAVVVPSRGPEPFGMAAVEAAGSGLPIIINDQANIAEEAVQGGFGLTFTTGSVAALAAAMRRLADDDALIERMSAQARSRAKELTQSESAWCDQLMARYRVCLVGAGGTTLPPMMQEGLAS
ncbi:glycosyltransferase family 4 protein [Tianweitania sp.]|uniref:glycosyltransferase family 4 protein n=1 Tax=Tianweitania sp. TaxID=2021634 RepID=UPI00289718DA|nr:glycosyltransferase family 4 protein [Tianweitania sp.]